MPGMTNDKQIGGEHYRSASMRPRLNAGDDAGEGLGLGSLITVASMRPRLNAGDDWRRSTSPPRISACFNEAPAKCRG